MRLLLTGSTGFVGRNLLSRASARGWKVLAPVRDESRLARILEEDGTGRRAVEPLPADPAHWPQPLRIDAAVHAAGALFERHLDDFLATNVTWTLSVMDRLPKRCPTIILSSQSAGGPTPRGRDSRDESCEDAPISAYGESKLRMERAVRREFPSLPITILRPPMILGARDSATLQLFRMARGLIRTKPGFRAKTYSFIAVSDLLTAIDACLRASASLPPWPYYTASRQTFTDWKLLAICAASMNARGVSLPLPQLLVRSVSALIDSNPTLRAKLPSLTRDRAREIWPNRWVVNPSAFEEATGWSAPTTLAAALDEARQYYLAKGLL